MSEEWGPWIEHDGKGCPCVGIFVHSVTDDAEELMHIAHGHVDDPNAFEFCDLWDWGQCETHNRLHMRIIRYRIRKPRALQDLIKLVEELPEKVEA